MENNQWSIVHEELQIALAAEIALRREILGNMSQQEYVLLIGDVDLKEALYIECNKLVHHLKESTKKRGILTRKIFDHLPSDILGTTLEEVLDPFVELEAETLLLYQKAKGLTEKIHSQHLRNKTLYEMILKEGPLNIDNPALHCEMSGNKRKGPSLITIDYPDEKKEI